ncbi:hypothetical protein BJX99DRAFT_232032 [Aspergillus californicus]
MPLCTCPTLQLAPCSWRRGRVRPRCNLTIAAGYGIIHLARLKIPSCDLCGFSRFSSTPIVYIPSHLHRCLDSNPDSEPNMIHDGCSFLPAAAHCLPSESGLVLAAQSVGGLASHLRGISAQIQHPASRTNLGA